MLLPGAAAGCADAEIITDAVVTRDVEDESVTVIVAEVSAAAVHVPDKIPSLERVTPDGSPLADHVISPVPPVAE
jgi:hypothetical protein